MKQMIFLKCLNLVLFCVFVVREKTNMAEEQSLCVFIVRRWKDGPAGGAVTVSHEERSSRCIFNMIIIIIIIYESQSPVFLEDLHAVMNWSPFLTSHHTSNIDLIGLSI